jgi:hypothetical protein
MEIFIVLIAVVVFGTIWYVNRGTELDTNKDGKVDIKDAGVVLKQTAKVIVDEVKKTADLNKDGKVDSADATVAVQAVKATATKAKAAVKAKTTRKPRAPKV